MATKMVYRLRNLSIVLCIGYAIVGLSLWFTTQTKNSFTKEKSDKGGQLSLRYQQPSFTPVVIVAYMRTGSTLTGNLIQQDPSVFYVFEPLIDMIRQFQHEQMEKFPDIKFLSDRPMMLVKEEVEQLYRAWFTCDMEYILSDMRRYHVSFLKFGLKTKLLFDCLDDASNTVYQRNKMPCTDMLRNLCLESKRRVFKTIRTPLVWLKELMDEFPTMKIVHLVRDPRAVIMSQRRFGECSRDKHGGIAGCSKRLCSSLEEDLTSAEMFSKLYPGRIFTLKYEDLALTPGEKTKELYDFLDMNYTDKIKNYVVNITMSGNNASYMLDSVRPDSRVIVDKWRTNISDVTLEIVQIMCKYVMRKLSYHHFIKPV